MSSSTLVISRYKAKFIYVQCQHVASVNDIDLSITQANLISAIDGTWVEETADLRGQKVNHASESACPCDEPCMLSEVLVPGARAGRSGT